MAAADNTAAHHRLARKWVEQVWSAWAPHHDTIREWNTRALGDRAS